MRKLLLTLTLAAAAWPAAAQIHVLVNAQGRSILVRPDEKDKEAYIARRMRELGGSGWRVDFETGEKGCVARRSITYIDGKPTRWVVATGETWALAEKNARDQAQVITNAGTGNFEGTVCNKSAAPLKKLDLGELERRAARER